MKNKKSIIAVVAVCILGIVGTTIAYYTTNKNFANIFRTSDYSVSVTEEFESPNDWTPGTTTDKTVIATNTGNVDAAVRVSYVESWEDADGNPLPLVDNQSPAQRYAVINYANTSKWIESEENGNNYYYYKYKLAPGATTPTFIESVTYNELANIDVDEDCDDESTCTLTLDGHAGGKYKLTITVETAQYDKYKEIWNTEVDILEDLPYTIVSGDLDTVGSIVKIADEEFYVIGQEDENHVKMLSKWNLKVGYESATNPYTGETNIIKEYTDADEGYNLQSSDMVDRTPYYYGNVKFSDAPYWHNSTTNRLKPEYGGYATTTSGGNTYYVNTLGTAMSPYIYTNSKENDTYLASIAEYVDYYVNYLNSKGNNTTGRLISMHDIEELINDGNPLTSPSGNFSSYNIEGKEWIYSTTYWTGSIDNRTTECITHIGPGNFYNCHSYHYETNNGVRPLIILEK